MMLAVHYNVANCNKLRHFIVTDSLLLSKASRSLYISIFLCVCVLPLVTKNGLLSVNIYYFAGQFLLHGCDHIKG